MSRPVVAIGVVTDIFGGSAMNGPNACIAAFMESDWPWFCIASPSVVRAENGTVGLFDRTAR